jgi:hypothetical protein
MFAMFVNMVSLLGGFQCQQHELALIFNSAETAVTNSPIFLTIAPGTALIFESKWLQYLIIRECLKEVPFNVVRCAINCWRIGMRHQLRHIFRGQAFTLIFEFKV